MMIQGLSEENRFLPCLWPSNTLSLSRKSQIGIYVKSILIKLHGLVVQMSFIWDFEIVCKDEFSGSTTLFTWRQRFLLISNRGSPSLQHFCIMFFFEFAMPRKSWKRKGTSVSAEVKIRPKSCGYWKSKMEVASCCLSEPRSSLAFETFMKWLALRECSYACVGRVMSEEPLSHQMGAVAEDASHVNWCALTHDSKCVKMYQSPVHEAVLCQSRNCLFSWMSSQRNAWRGIVLESPWAALPKPQGGMTLMIPEVYSRVIVTNVTAPNDLGPRFNPMLINFHYPAMRLSAVIIFFIDWAASCRKGSKFKRQSSSCPNSLPKRQTDSLTHQQTHTDINTNASAQCLYYIVGFQVSGEGVKDAESPSLEERNGVATPRNNAGSQAIAQGSPPAVPGCPQGPLLVAAGWCCCGAIGTGRIARSSRSPPATTDRGSLLMILSMHVGSPMTLQKKVYKILHQSMMYSNPCHSRL